ncbi:carbohydrate kinase family protein [Streptomyces sp. NBC_00638]|uniref:carbohydrate kinase family protein n=1 Tax=unclassified Streptomyces TaxID=2593676 RepID=UPI002254B09D|nr:carbohydrate kinase family protein [Streptomyces sp. NBC_00638]MCX5008341.1 carbohydrate kinase family protein [Streptomyces sp. NBC_00638]
MSTLFGRDVGDSGRAACDVVVLGSLVMDRKYFAAGTFAAALPVWGVQRQHGGVGRNVAVNTARLGGRTAFAGLSGFGPDAVDLETELSALGVHLEVLRTEAGIGRFDVLLDERGRQITSTIELPDPASAKSLCGPALAAVIGRAKAVVAEGGLDEDVLAWVSREARRHAIPMCCMPTRQADFGPRGHLLGLYDVLVLNVKEAAALTGRPGDAAEQAERLLVRGPRVVVVTSGADGAAVASAERPAAVMVPAEAGPCADDTGAGDALASAFLLALVDGASPRAALARGLRAARLTIGCRESTCRALTAR